MRWDAQALHPSAKQSPVESSDSRAGQTGPAADALLPLMGLVRSVSTPEFADITFHEVAAKSILNKVPAGSNMPFQWTINPYRGCSHACVYCFARKTHTYLDFDAGLDFDRQIIVKINAAEVLRRELAKPSWGHHQVALGTNTDPYQRAEGRYRLMPGIIGALADSGTPLSILTKGTLLARDIPLLKHAAAQVPVGVGISLAMTDETLSESVEPGTPGPRARLKLITRLREAGLPCGVMAMPILPWLTDSDEALDHLFSSLAQAGATGVTAGALYLKPGTREWFMQWIAARHPELAGKYEGLYGSGSYASKEYRTWLAGRVRYFKGRYGFSDASGFSHRDIQPAGESGDALLAPLEKETQYPTGLLPFRGESATGESATGQPTQGTAAKGKQIQGNPAKGKSVKSNGTRSANPEASQPTLF